MVDGALGMAYGVSCTTFLLSFGLAPAVAVASVKTAEVFTTAASGWSHLRLGNVDRQLFWRLLVPGVTGGVLGAYLLGNLPGEQIKPFVAAYLLIMGGVIVARAFCRTPPREMRRGPVWVLGFLGGLLDATGGGGWGPIVTANLMGHTREPRLVIGSVNLAEFFVTVAQAATFLTVLGIQHHQVILALVAGGVVAAPLAAYVCRIIPPRILMFLVGGTIILLSLRILLLVLHSAA